MQHHTSPVGRWLLAITVSLTSGIALARPTHAIERSLPNGDVAVPTELLATAGVARAVFDMDCLTESTCITASEPAMRTSDGGRTWRRLLTASRSPYVDVSDVACPTATTCIGSLPYSGLVRTTDAGVTWRVVPDGPTTLAVTCPTSTRCIGLDVRSSSATFVTASLDAGLTWTEPMQASIPISAMECGTTTFCASISNRSIATSVDGGVSWTIRTTLTDEFPADLACAGDAMCIATSSLQPRSAEREQRQRHTGAGRGECRDRRGAGRPALHLVAVSHARHRGHERILVPTPAVARNTSHRRPFDAHPCSRPSWRDVDVERALHAD